MKKYEDYTTEEKDIYGSFFKRKDSTLSKEERKFKREIRKAFRIYQDEQTVIYQKQEQQWMAEREAELNIGRKAFIDALKNTI